jgi:hypothetical protein
MAKQQFDREFYTRTFLNMHAVGGTALIEGVVKRLTATVLDAELKIADCRHVVTLDFTGSDFANLRYKANLLRMVVNDFTRSLLAACDEMETQ